MTTKQGKYTAGRWVIMPRGHNGIDAVQVWPEQDGQGRVCTITNHHDEDKRAALIAAAPDLLAECEHTARNLRSMIAMLPVKVDAIERKSLESWLARTEAAIARAEGKVRC